MIAFKAELKIAKAFVLKDQDPDVWANIYTDLQQYKLQNLTPENWQFIVSSMIYIKILSKELDSPDNFLNICLVPGSIKLDGFSAVEDESADAWAAFTNLTFSVCGKLQDASQEALEDLFNGLIIEFSLHDNKVEVFGLYGKSISGIDIGGGLRKIIPSIN